MLPHCLARNTLMQAWCIGNVQAVGYLGSALHCQHHTISSAPSLAVGDREYYGAPARRASERAKLSNDFDEGAEGVGRPDSGAPGFCYRDGGTYPRSCRRCRVAACAGDIGMKLGEITNANPGVAIGSRFSIHSTGCGAASRPACEAKNPLRSRSSVG